MIVDASRSDGDPRVRESVGFASRVQGAAAEVIAARLGSGSPSHVLDTAWRSYWRIVDEKNPDAIALAEIIALQFREVLQHPSTSLKDACKYYTMLHDLYRLGASRNADIKRLDSNSIEPFGRWVKKHVERVELPLPKISGEARRVGYLCSWGMFTDGNPVADIVHEAVNEHARRADREIFAYVTIAGTNEYVASLNGVSVRDIRQGYDFERLAEAAAIIRNDRLDVLIADGIGATATYLFQSRVAPVQIYYDFGCPFWSIDELDWAISTYDGGLTDVGLPLGRISKAWAIMLSGRRLRRVRELANDRLRAMLPANRVIIGAVTRLSKVSVEYARVLRAILAENVGVHCVLAGPGESYALKELEEDPELVGRVSVFRGFQEMADFARIIDVFVDTFPFSGGAAPMEVASFGVPIVSMVTHDRQRDYSEERDVRLVAQSERQYIDLVTELSTGGPLYMSATAEALSLAARFTDRARMIERTEEAISRASEYVYSARRNMRPS